MGRANTLFLLLLLGGCASHLADSAPRGLTLTLLSARDDGGQLVATLKLSNASDQPFHYRAYSREQLFPDGATEVRHGLRWVFVPLAGCGTGVQTVTLNPGESVVLRTRVWYRWPERVYRRVRVRISDAERGVVVRSAGFNVPPGLLRAAAKY